MPQEAPENQPEATLTLTLQQSTLEWLEGLRAAIGLRTTAEVASRLLEDLAAPTEGA